MKEFITKNTKETEKFGADLVKKVIHPERGREGSQRASASYGVHMQGPTFQKGKAIVFGLEGELGAGKTTFVKGFAKALGIKEKISSPTFVLMKIYKLKDKNYHLLYHVDAYRIKDHQDLIPLGIKEILDNPENIVLIEWSDRVKEILPKKYLKIHIDHVSESERKIIII